MKILGLTGGIASGKSTAAKYLAKLGAKIVDADKISHELAKSHAPIWEIYVRHFGKKILLANDELDRAAIGKIIYADRNERAWTNAATHPLIKQAMSDETDRLKGENVPAVFWDVPLLFEAKLTTCVEKIWLVYVPRDIQLKRLMLRDGCTKEDALKRIAAQMPLDEKRRLADVIIDNGGGRDEMLRQIDAAWEKTAEGYDERKLSKHE